MRFPVSALKYCVTSHQSLQSSVGLSLKKKKKMVKISPALTCLPGLAGGWLYVKELEMWFQQGNFVAILRKNGSVTSPRNMRGSIKTTLGIKARFLDGAYCLV